MEIRCEAIVPQDRGIYRIVRQSVAAVLGQPYDLSSKAGVKVMLSEYQLS